MIEAMNGAVSEGLRGRSPRGRVVQWLVDAIAKGELRPGDAIPTVDELAASLGVARNTAAAAVVEAERRRVVERRSPGARKRFVPIFVSEAPLAASTVFVLGHFGRFADRPGTPRWTEPFVSLEIVPHLSEAGKFVTVINNDTIDEAGVDALFRSPPAGMVVASYQRHPAFALHVLERCRETGVPAVAYGNAPELRSFDRVFTDHRAGARMLTEWLLKRGCRAIAPIFPFPPSDFWMQERQAGYAEAMKAAGLEPLQCAVLGDEALRVHAQGERRFRIYRALALERIMELRRDGGLDAILCLTDEWVSPVIAAIRDLGLEPNRDILVAGYDNITRGNELAVFEATRPAVTIDKHNEKTAADLAALLLARMAGTLPPEPQARTHPQELVVCATP